MTKPEVSLDKIAEMLLVTQDVVNPPPTALEVAILDFALRQYPEPIYGYSVKVELEQADLRDPSTSAGGLYRALGACARNGWLDREKAPSLSDHGPARVLYNANGETTKAWLFGIRSLIGPTVALNLGRGRRKVN